MRYGDDQCEECGGIRVAKSTMCASCLVKERDILEKEVFIKMAVIEVQKKRISHLETLLDEAVWYGFKQNRKVADMIRQIDELTQEI